MVSNLEYYRTFFWVANLKNFTMAAEKLCVSQSAVSQTIKKLENEIGCPLFDRTGKELRLTGEGEQLLKHVRHAIEEFEVGENLVTRLSSTKSGELVIGATETAIRYHLGPWLRDFKAENPSVRITFKGSTTSELCRLLQEGTIEIAFLISPIADADRFHLQEILSFQDIPVVSSDYDMDLDIIYRPKDLMKFPFISITEENAVRSAYDQWFWSDDALLLPDFTVRNIGLVLPLIKEGLGIGIVPDMYAQNDLSNGNLKLIKTTTLPPKRAIYAATNPNVTLSAVGKALLKLVLPQ